MWFRGMQKDFVKAKNLRFVALIAAPRIDVFRFTESS